MSMPKSITELNAHSWYRLLKVVYSAAFVLLGLTSLAIVFGVNQEQILFDSAKTTITCNDSAKTQITAQQLDMYFSPADFSNGQFNYANNLDAVQLIQEVCVSVGGPLPLDPQQEKNLQQLIGQHATSTLDIAGYIRAMRAAGIPDDESYDHLIALGYVDVTGDITTTQQASSTTSVTIQRIVDGYKASQSDEYPAFLPSDITVKPVYAHEGGWLDIMLFSLLDILVILGLAEGFRRVFYYVVLGTSRPRK
jgi:hypothetical protein